MHIDVKKNFQTNETKKPKKKKINKQKSKS